MKYLRWLLFPFALLYGLAVIIRNLLYDAGILKSCSFKLPVIAVGNLDVGGSGKTPMVEYLVRLLKSHYHIATLSRGYGRVTKGFIKADAITGAAEIGDEPAQLKHKFNDITVAVCEDRVAGIEQLRAAHDLILMDDAYQHRAVKPGLNVLLFDYNKFKNINLLLPAGNRREPFSGRKRAQIIIITKCPASLSESDQHQLTERMDLRPGQQLFFTTIGYLPLQYKDGSLAETDVDEQTTLFLLTGIASPEPMLAELGKRTPHIIHHKYPDHHRFSLKNITKLADEFNSCPAQKKIIVTTEKDIQRLGEQDLLTAIAGLPLYTLPIGVEFLNNGAEHFNQLINNYVRQYTKHNGLH